MAVKHGGNIQEISELYQIDKKELIDFSANINPLGIPQGVKATLTKGIAELQPMGLQKRFLCWEERLC